MPASRGDCQSPPASHSIHQLTPSSRDKDAASLMSDDSDISRLRDVLSRAIDFSELTRREVERQLGKTTGSLSRVLGGHVELKIRHVLEICRVIEFPPLRLFRLALPETEKASEKVELVTRLLQQIFLLQRGDVEPLVAGEAPLTASEVEQAVRLAVERLLHLRKEET